MQTIKGKPVSSGIIVGRALVFHSQKGIILREKIDKSRIKNELERFNSAVKKTRGQLKKLYDNLQKTMGKDSALIIETQYLLLKDGNLLNNIKNTITSNSVNSEWAIKQIEKKYIDFFNNVPDLSFKEKRNDISDILNRIVDNLRVSKTKIETDIENVILVADDIPPSIAANILSEGKLLGLVLNKGGETSHSVILARTLEIPIILNTENATDIISNDDQLIIDGLTGEVFINPTKEFLAKYSTKKEKYEFYKERLKKVIKLPDVTKDKHKFNLYANIELPFESDIVQSYGVKGIGLFRTEFLYSNPSIVNSVEQQFLIYKNIAQKFFPDPVVIRTFDVGSDKDYNQINGIEEPNPALGIRAIRFFVKKKELLKNQIKAILMANESNNIKILFPMITEIEEMHFIKNIIEDTKKELISEKKLPVTNIELGIMIEIPGTIKIIKHLKNEIDFFSIGTNDLIQYLLAVDRNNSALSYLYSPFHPAVLKVLFEIKEEIAKIGKEVMVCGEMAGRVFTALMLLGLGYTNFSMNPLSIIEIKRIFTNIHYSYIKKTMRQIIKLSSKTEIEELLMETMLKKYPHLFVKQAVF